MKIIEAEGESIVELGDTLSEAVSAQAIIDRCGLAHLIVLLRVRMGFPPETFALAVQPLIEGYAGFVQLRPVPGSRRYGEPGGQLYRGLVTALRALDQRRGQILPRNAPPEMLGALAHRWTYGVFAAALLRDIGRSNPDVAVQVFERCVPPIIQAWLAEDPALTVELRAVLAGNADPSSAIATLVNGAVITGARPAIEATVPPCASTDGIADAVPSSVESAPMVPANDEPEFLDSVEAEGPADARRFMEWLRRGLADGSLVVNARGALVHGVEDGLLLVSPGIFRAFIQQDGASGSEPRAAAKRLQREVLRAKWHLRTDGGVNLHGYAWKQDGCVAARLHGIIVLSPGRFVAAVPAINPALARVVETAAAGE
jgi:hypothetical protein